MGSSYSDMLRLVEQFVDSGKTKEELQAVAKELERLRQRMAEDQDLADTVIAKLYKHIQEKK